MKVRKKITLLLLGSISLIFVFFVNATSNENYAQKIKTFEEFVKTQMEIDKIPGLSIGFYKDDFVWAKGFGYADLENKIPATDKSAYRLASNTKSMVAVAILQLVEKGKIDLDAEVQKYVPYFPRKKWPVTVRQLLGHLGGISHYKNYELEGRIKEHKDTKESLEIFADWDLISEPGSEYHYSSYAYNLLGAVIEGAAKQSFGEYLRKSLWGPLDMNETYMDDPYKLLPNRVRGYRLIEGEIKNSEFVDISSRFAAGGTRSTVLDLLKYARGLSTEKVLTQKSIDLMYTSMATTHGYFTDYGMGWRVDPVNGRFHVYHTGGQPETRTLLVRFPRENFAIALAYNLEGGNLHAYSHRLFHLIFDEPWDLDVYTGSKIDDAIFRGLWYVFNYGLAYFDRYEKSFTTDRQELVDAFKYLNKCLNPDSLEKDYHKFNKKIRDGQHPIANQAFVKIGSFMAAKLKHEYGTDQMEKYHKMGAIGFFNDYLKIMNSQPPLTAETSLNSSLEDIIKKWNQDWVKTNTNFTRQASLTPVSDLEKVGKLMKRTFAGCKIYPNFSTKLAEITRYFYLKENFEKALEVARLSVALYPEIAVPHIILGNVYICTGKMEKALQCYKKAKEINKDDQAISARSLNQYATELIYFNNFTSAMDLLNLALKLYPNEARFYSSMGEIYLRQSKPYFEKALQIDPMFEPARRRMKEIW